MKGIILAGGSGTRLYPATRVVSKQLAARLRQAHDLLPAVHAAAGGHQGHPDHLHAPGPAPFRGVAGRRLLAGRLVLVQGAAPAGGSARRPIIIGQGVPRRRSRLPDPGRQHLLRARLLGDCLRDAAPSTEGGLIFGYWVSDPERYGVVEFDADGRVLSIEEKPEQPRVRLRRTRPVSSTTAGSATSPRA